MAKKETRDGPGAGTQAEQEPAGEQVSDILLIMDQMKLIVRALSEIEKNGRAKTVPADEKHQNSFLKFDRYSTVLESFIKNFWSQLKDPARMRLFKMPSREFKGHREAIKDLAEGKETDRVKEFLKKYEIRPRNAGQTNINDKKDNIMEKKEQAANAASPSAAQAGEGAKRRYPEAAIDWNQLKLFGLSKEFLQEKGFLDPMMKGYKTNQLVPVSMNFGSALLRTDARLSFQQSPGGSVVLAIHGIRQEPELQKAYFGHVFSEEDRKNLKETGNMGRVVELKIRGEAAPYFVSKDRLTNEIVAMKQEYAIIPDEFKGVQLSKEEKQDLRDGKQVYLEGMTAKSGRDFSGAIQVSADRRGIENIFPKSERLFNQQTLGGVQLSRQQVEDLNEGRAIFVEDMTRKSDGQKFSSFVKIDEGSGNLSFTSYNPDSPEGAREIYIPKELNGAPLTPEDRKQFREGKAVFIEDMTSRSGEEFSAFVRFDLETGRPSYSKTPDGFDERQAFKVPAELNGKTLTATERAALQDGRAALIKGMTGPGGEKFDSWAKVNNNGTMINLFNENPDQKNDAARRNMIAEKIEQKHEKGKGKKVA